MPNKETFKIKPIAELLPMYVGNGKGWIDPFANDNSPAEFTNDINPDKNTLYHLESEEFIKQLVGKYDGCLFDPPYSLEQLKRSYENIGRKFTMRDGQIANRWTATKDLISDKLRPGAFTISFGWNSNGFGITRGFQIFEILLVSHGAGHNDTIVTVEYKE